MRFRSRTMLLLAVPWWLHGSARGMQAEGPEVKIPALHGRLLSGQPVDLPGAIAGRVAVLVIGFSQASRPEVAAWGRRLAADFSASDTVQYFEMPVLAEVPRLLRGLVLGKVKDGVPQRAWAHCLPVTDRESEWKAAVDFKDADRAYVVVVDGRGVVRSRLQGDASDTSYAAMKGEVETLRRH